MFIIKVQPRAFAGTPVTIDTEYKTIREALKAYSFVKKEAIKQGLSFYRQDVKRYAGNVLKKETASKGGFILIRKQGN
jgi:hypothetical protein